MQLQKSSKYDKLYLPHQKQMIFNDGDNELHPVVIKLPDPPDIHYIDGYGLPPDQQKFQKVVEPPRLKLLSETCLDRAQQKFEGKMVAYMQQVYFWQSLNDDSDNYKEEIAFIKKQIWHLFYGYWCFIFGRPTWIPPKHYTYLNFYYPTAVKDNRIEYRDEDRIVKTVEHYCDTTTETFKDVDDKGNALKNDRGVYEMIDVGHRTCIGDIHPKRRRKGVTMQNCCDAIHTLITGRERHCIVQADTGQSAEDIYIDHILPAWKRWPIYLKPIYDGDASAKAGIYLQTPSSVVGGRYLGGYLIWNDSAKEGANDRRKAHFILNDESGKNVNGDVKKRYNIDKLTMIQGADIHGISRNPSTVEELGAGGMAYQELFYDSNFYKRNIVGMTDSGLFRLFRPVYMGWDGFIDEWGYSVVNTPTEDQLIGPPRGSQFKSLNTGSKQYWVDKYDRMLKDTTQHSSYRLEIRKHPMVSSDCFRGGAGDLGFSYVKIDQRIAELRGKNLSIRGNFKRNGDAVEWSQSDDGRFVVSNLFLGQQNQMTYGNQVWSETHQAFIAAKRPAHMNRFTGGCDPFDYKTSPDKKEFHLSKGGFSILHNPDPSESNKPIQEWESYQLVCWYENRPPSLEMFVDDVLAASIWYGALINVESNLKRVIQILIESGYGGYLWYGTNPDGSVKSDPGTYNGSATKNDMLNSVRDFIEYRVHKCCIKEFLEQAREMRDPRSLTRFDGFASAGWAIYGQKSTYGMAVDRIDGVDSFDLSEIYENAPNMY